MHASVIVAFPEQLANHVENPTGKLTSSNVKQTYIIG